MKPLVTLLAFFLPALTSAAPLKVHTDFPGGSVKVEKIDDDARRITFSAGGTLERGWVCWWCFKVAGLEPGETITLELVGSGFAVPDQASVSADGRVWTHTAPGKRDKGRITYQVKVEGKEAWFAWGPKFTSLEAKDVLDAAAKKCAKAEVFELCKSKKGRPVWALKIDDTDEKDPNRSVIWIHARQHAWESGASWVSKGLIDWIVSDDPAAKALRKKAILILIPIMDVDNVEDGMGGKNQKPHDHNRDWCEEPVHPEVQAAIAGLRRYRKTMPVSLFIDLHNPGPGDRQPFFFTPDKEMLSLAGRNLLAQFLDAARQEMKGPLKLAPTPRETNKGYDPNWHKISINWVAKNLGEGVVPVCLETTWNSPQSTSANYERIGQELGVAIEKYLRVRK